MTELSKEIKIELIKTAIQTEAGWKALALSLNTEEAKAQCIELLKEIGGNKISNVYDFVKEEMEKEYSNQNFEMAPPQEWNINLSDQLVKSLEMYMEKVK